MKKRKLFLCALAALTAALTLSGCAGNPSAGESSESAGKDNSTASDSLADVELVVSDGSAKVTIEDGKFMAGGKPIWFCGTNTPWDNWDDFGGNFDAAFWKEHFHALHEAGINSSRVWILCSGDAGIRFDKDGSVSGMSDKFWNHVDQLMAIAAEEKIYIMATMMSFDCCKDGNRNHNKFRTMIEDEKLSQSYVDNYIIPFAKRYDSNDYLYSIDLCNEPDWIHENKEEGKLDWKPLVRFFGQCAQAIHRNSDILVTTGIGYIPNNSDTRGTNVVSDQLLEYYAGTDSYMDFNSVHFYDWMIEWYGVPFGMTPEEYGLDTTKPNVMGECSAKGSELEKIDLVSAAQQLYDNGWDGVYPWTSTGTDNNGGFEEVTAYSKNMLSQIEDKIFP
ncbi:MAG: cellulase family glycosylhydrolase [Oscillospiraceae bacterium]|nr:cellulase family glycosylhydrolase [Oscillospiraceae bacterium]